MPQDSVMFAIFAVFTGAAVLATLALQARQAIIVAYIVIGIALGPAGLGVVEDAHWLQEISEIGIVFLLYLLGLNMVPRQLLRMFREAILVTGLSCVAFLGLGLGLARLFGFGWADAFVIGATAMFSSTIIGLKLLPTTALHHQHTGQIMISVLLLQDLIAILVLLALQGAAQENPVLQIAREVVALPVLIGIAFALEHWVIEPCKWITPDQLIAHFAATQGQTYDWIGLVGSQVFNRGVNNKGAAFCSEWIAQAGGVPNPELYNPGTLRDLNRYLNEVVQ